MSYRESAVDLVESNPGGRQVDFAEAKRYAATLGAPIFEVSAKSGTSVPDAFVKVCEIAVQREVASPAAANNSSSNSKSDQAPTVSLTGSKAGGAGAGAAKDGTKSTKCC